MAAIDTIPASLADRIAFRATDGKTEAFLFDNDEVFMKGWRRLPSMPSYGVLPWSCIMDLKAETGFLECGTAARGGYMGLDDADPYVKDGLALLRRSGAPIDKYKETRSMSVERYSALKPFLADMERLLVRDKERLATPSFHDYPADGLPVNGGPLLLSPGLFFELAKNTFRRYVTEQEFDLAEGKRLAKRDGMLSEDPRDDEWVALLRTEYSPRSLNITIFTPGAIKEHLGAGHGGAGYELSYFLSGHERSFIMMPCFSPEKDLLRPQEPYVRIKAPADVVTALGKLESLPLHQLRD